MKLTFTLSLDDYKEFSKFTMKRLSESGEKSNKSLNRIVFLVLILFFTMLFITKGKEHSFFLFDFDVSTAILVSIFFVVFFTLFIFFQIQISKNMMPTENGIMIGEKVLSFTDEGIMEEHPVGYCFYKWSSITSLEVNKDTIYLYVDTILALIIPKQAFENDSQREELLELVSKHIKK